MTQSLPRFTRPSGRAGAYSVGLDGIAGISHVVDVARDEFGDPRHARLAKRRAFLRQGRLNVLLSVFIGGCVGGALRYAVTSTWPAVGLPWSTWAVNVIGSFAVTFVVVAGEALAAGTYLRPLLATGLCGGLTTFASVVTVTDQLIGHGRGLAAFGYIGATIAGGLAAGSFGVVAGRALRANRVRSKRGGRDES